MSPPPGRTDAPPPWVQTADEVTAALGTDATTGLGTSEAVERLARLGRNELEQARRATPLMLLVRQFANTMTAVLGVAAAVTWIIGDRVDTIVIGVILVLNGTIGFAQEHRAERSLDALSRMTASTARVVRDGATREVDATELVPGDLVRLQAGDVVPADVRLTTVAGTRVDEAVLTGESEPVAKTSRPVPDPDAVVADRVNMAFKGTAVTYGRADALVVATGASTELGRIAGLLGAEQQQATPLQRRLTVLGRRLAAAALAVCGVVFVVGVLRGEAADEMFLAAVSLAVAAVPEGLPAVVTVTLAIGARRMADERSLVRRLSAVETLGSVTVICSDKTGTLTENRMTIEHLWTPSGTYVVEGAGYDPVGTVSGFTVDADPHVPAVIAVAVGCNDAELAPPDRAGEPWALTGDPTEGALLALAGRLGADRDVLTAARARLDEVPFDADRKRMSTVLDRDGRRFLAVKGAFDSIAPLLDGPPDLVTEAGTVADTLGADGYRVLALAERELEPDEWDADADSGWERDLHLVGLVAIADPPRAAAAEAVARCRAAGIMPVMITGDHPSTAVAIARRLGILDPDDGADAVMTGQELTSTTDLARRVGRVKVYARTSPEQKLDIVEAWRQQGAIVAMTGDGVNDAPALRRSDIGVAMGINGTDVSQQAADMVLADDNFATIVGAVAEGRHIYDNIRRFVRYLLTTNSGEIWVMLLAILVGQPVPLTAAQILWINLVTDGLPAIALGVEPGATDLMDRPPRRTDESILGAGLWQEALWVGLLMAGVALGLQAGAIALDWPWPTMVFTTVALLQLGNALAVRSETRSFWSLGPTSNPWLLGAVMIGVIAQLGVVYAPFLHTAFDTESLDAAQLVTVLVCSATAFIAVEIAKAIRRR